MRLKKFLMPERIKPIAIHLPQFHPFEENDLWWGRGFTEWRNVVKSRPLFKEHYQPHLPGDLGFYDLRVSETRHAQVEMARRFGIHGFCYYYYWFNGKRLMHQPLEAILKDKSLDFPFMYCWANENWTKKWDGEESNILIEQKYSTADDLAHIIYLLENVFTDERYIKVDGKPFFLVYRPDLFPNIKGTLQLWREEASKRNIELFLGYTQGFQFKEDPRVLGFDIAIDFQPNFYTKAPKIRPNKWRRLLDIISKSESISTQNRIIKYSDFIKFEMLQKRPEYPWAPMITPMWDNTARRKKGAFILKDSSPTLYGEWLEHILSCVKDNSNNFLFLNAWNEWAEGNHLEPCLKWGLGYLEKTKEVLSKFDET